MLLHTGSAVTIRIEVSADTARVEVEDDCPVLPVGGILDPTAACGRGLVLVDRLSQEWGVTPIGHTGKKVWLKLVAGAETTALKLTTEELLDLWDTDADDAQREDILAGAGATAASWTPPSAAGEPTRRVRVAGVATDLLNATKSHLDDLIRDLTLATQAAAVGGQHNEDLIDLGFRLRHLAMDLIEFRNEIRRQALDGARRHVPTIILQLDLPLSLRSHLIDYRDALDLADELCTAERLLLAPAPAEHAQFRQWKLTSIISQLTDEPPDHDAK